MGLFSKPKGQKPVLPAHITSHLADYASQTLRRRGGARIDQGFGWDYVGPVINGLRGPDRESIIGELWDLGSNSSDPLVTVGAYELLNEGASPEDDERFIALRDVTLEYLQANGYSSGDLNRDEANRWIDTHGDLRTGFDRIVKMDLPAEASAPELPSLAVGESLLLALTEPLPHGNAFYAERRDEKTYVIFSERVRSSDDPTRERYEEDYLGTFASVHDLCVALGKMFGTRPWCADDRIAPYFLAGRN